METCRADDTWMPTRIEALADQELPTNMSAEWTSYRLSSTRGRSELRIGLYNSARHTFCIRLSVASFLVLAACRELSVSDGRPSGRSGCVFVSGGGVDYRPGTAVQTLAEWNARPICPTG